MKPALLLLASLLLSPAGSAQESEPAFNSNRWQENYQYLAKQPRKNVYDNFKYLPLLSDRDDVYLSLGGNFRERLNSYNNDLFGLKPHNDGQVFLHRFLVHANLHVSEQVRAFIQLSSYLSDTVGLNKGSLDNNSADLQQGFVDLHFQTVTARVGRQEFALGSSRLISVREGQNVRRAFDGVHVRLKHTYLDVEAFGFEEVEVKPASFDDQGNTQEKLWGLNSKWAFKPTKAEFYYIGLQRQAAKYQAMMADETRHSFGTRMFGKQSGWDWNHEGIYQTGRYGSLTINAWTLASLTGYTFNSLKWRPRLGLSANIASGDDNAKDKQLNTFNPLYPNLSYFEEAAMLAPQNFFNIMPNLAIQPLTNVRVSVDWNFYWRLSKNDAVYVRGLNPLPQTLGVNGQFVTHAFSGNVDWEINKYVSLGFSYSHFFAGQVITEAGGHDTDYLRSQVNVAF
jgi:hypothetical protein